MWSAIEDDRAECSSAERSLVRAKRSSSELPPIVDRASCVYRYWLCDALQLTSSNFNVFPGLETSAVACGDEDANVMAIHVWRLGRNHAARLPRLTLPRSDIPRSFHAALLYRSISDSTRTGLTQPPELSAPKPTRRFWTTEELNALHRLKAEGYGASDMARALDRPLVSVWRKLAASDEDLQAARRNPWSHKDIEAAKSLRAGGMKWSDVAARLRRSPESVRKMARKGPKALQSKSDRSVCRPGKRYKPWSESDIEMLTALKESGLTYNAISREIGRSHNSVRRKWYDLLAGRRSGVRTKKLFTEEEDAELISLYSQGISWKSIQAAMPSRSSSSLSNRVRALNVRRTRPTSRDWSLQETNELLRLARLGTRGRDLSLHLPGRSETACHRKLAYLLATKLWTDNQEAGSRKPADQGP